MKKALLIILLLPLLSYSQSKRKKRLVEEKAAAELVTALTGHVRYLSDDKLEGRRSGTNGEKLAMDYITDQYKQMGLEPKGTDGYIQSFEIDEGKYVTQGSFLKIGDHSLALTEEYFPLAFSRTGSASGSAAPALNEYGQPWFKDLKDLLEENKNNPHFDIEDAIRKMADKAITKGATALILYNSSALTDNIRFNKNDRSEAVKIPVLYLTAAAAKKYCADHAATVAVEINTGFAEKKRIAHNIVGYIDNHAATTVVLGAHYDHLGFGEDKNAIDTFHQVHNGADDNASGTAALIELTRMLKKKAPASNNYLIIHFSGEELGLLGSKYWVEHPTLKTSLNYMINMDMVGRYDTARKLTIGGYGTSPVWGEVLKAANPPLAIHFDSTGSGPSDHASFYRANVPVLFLFTGSHKDYHKVTDDWDRINYTAQKDIVQLVYNIIGITDAKGKLPFAKTAEPAMGRSTKLQVTLGVMPDYGFTGTGMRIDGVSPGKTGEKAGLQAGDILLQLGEYKFVDVMSYMESLGKFKKGDKTKLKIKRGTEEKIIDIEF
ncbi:M28 family peptidase [Sediminibacterium ginsengisoli]|uniref:PDZ domain-containing protein n=1 Tax=Sediminibacterium ginsengisoli TaxID=413434 RepID=A0A1T4M5V6_9BACT|nr:M28 family peptidase [Sediminibacterium ginsengisoli]SJZ62236.1 PDZ domain-containing protein [Sediminibacterium ginsengisoli]